MAQAKSIGNVGRRGSKLLVPEPQESSESQLFLGWACQAKTSCLHGQATDHSGRTSAVRGLTVELSAHVLRAHSCQPDGSRWLITGNGSVRE